jgi:hypothetical protein
MSSGVEHDYVMAQRRLMYNEGAYSCQVRVSP